VRITTSNNGLYFAIETAVRRQDVAAGVESEGSAERLHGDDCAGDGIVFRDRILEKNLQRFPGGAAQIGQQLPVIQKVTAEDFGDAEYEMTVRDLFQDIHAEPFTEFHHAFLMA